MAAPVDEELVRTTVFRNMDYRWQKFGIAFDDLPILAVPAAIGFCVMGFVDVSMGWLFLGELCMGLFLVLVKWRKPPDHLQGLLILHFGARRLSHKMRDPRRLEFPLDHELRPPSAAASPSGGEPTNSMPASRRVRDS
ncbi:MAG: hypothetical protein Q8O67_32635 [Deltaproteobacteria bacterium]|nr:hypothetical protein [Deltaproteobacteria bacterium]